MNGKALGLIETIGLAAAIVAADTCLKSANVQLAGYERTRGFGLVTVKILGDVSAVNAAINSAKATLSGYDAVYSTAVIPRPSKGAGGLIFTKEMIGLPKEAGKAEIAHSKEFQIEKPQIDGEDEIEVKHSEEEDPDDDNAAVCNLCGDPNCPRVKGMPRKLCIHFKGE